MTRPPAAPWSLGVVLLSRYPEHNFLFEILDHSGVAYRRVQPGESPEAIGGCSVWLIGSYLPAGVPQDWTSAIRSHLNSGGGLVLLGNPAGLEDLFRVQTLGRDLGEGYYVPEALKSCPDDVWLHHFGGAAVRPLSGSSDAVGKLTGTEGEAQDAVGLVRPSESLSGIFVDVAKTCRYIQHGIPVVADGVPAPDGSAPLNDNILKAEDGHVLDWRRDRHTIEGCDFPFFTYPVADIWKELLLSEVFRVASKVAAPLKMLWYWPDRLPAVGQISYDSDHNGPDEAHRTIAALKDIDIRTTWLVIAPGYDKGSGVIESLKANDHEVGFHFDAGINPEDRWEGWLRQKFHQQLHEVARACSVGGFRSNKNHYTRWQGSLDLLEWCQESGISTDLTKLPSKLGTAGFFAGSAHPWLHHDIRGEPLDCLEIHGFTQDPVVTVPPVVQLYLLRQCARHNGVAAFTYHPVHIAKPGVEDALRQTIQLGRDLNLEWWTVEEIHDWELARRAIQWNGAGQPEGGALIRGRSGVVLTLDSDGDFSYLDHRFLAN
ncbi:MAG: hypothetical protein IT209_13330 [Armatimonadetes bacterium]|nr:hypothetical protein [Armatimonadota bacterium]